MKKFLFAITISLAFAANSQVLKPGFDKEEYLELMLISAQTTANVDYTAAFPQPENYNMMFRSEPIGLDNLWDLWIHNDKNLAVISVRGTTEKTESWLLNLYAAMVPAKGQIKWGDQNMFDYELSENPKAAVHAGWLLGTAMLSEDILQKVTYLYDSGVHDFLIIGHSQGGGISYLLTSHLLSLQKQGKLPADIQFKTYCSAAPKPGNLYYAYDFESQTQNGWACNVVNPADWVPEVPISIQTFDDFNETNPFVHADEIIAKQNLSTRIVLKHVYKKLNKPTHKAQSNYQRYLGDEAHKLVTEQIEGLEMPDYVPTNNYVRTGIQIILPVDETYFKAFPYDSTTVFTHHLHKPYLFLAERLETPFYEEEEENRASKKQTANTEWKLVSSSQEALKSWNFEVYQPTVTLDTNEGRIFGTTGCNRFSGSATYDGNNISIAKEMVMTKRGCPRIDEHAFINTLQMATSFIVDEGGSTMLLLNGDMVIMKFEASH